MRRDPEQRPGSSDKTWHDAAGPRANTGSAAAGNGGDDTAVAAQQRVAEAGKAATAAGSDVGGAGDAC